MMKFFGRNRYNPRDLTQYFGIEFEDADGGVYCLSEERRFHGRESIEGAKIEMIAGIAPEHWMDVRMALTSDPRDKGGWDKKIKKYGKPIEEGDRIALSLEDSEMRRYERVGFLSGEIVKIQRRE